MKCHISTLTKWRTTLENDFKKLQDEITLPCQFNFSFNTIEKCRIEKAIAAAYYWINEIKENIVKIEFGETYFTQYKYKLRKFTMLHELVHACQRTGIMYPCNKNWIDLDLKYQELINNTNWTGNELGKNSAENKKNLIYCTFGYIFEIWDEIFVIKNYPDFTKERLEILYGIVSSECNISKHDGYQELTKYAVFFEIIRAFFLKKISGGTTFSTKFSDICEKWIDKLKSVTTNNELKKIMDFLEPLTDSSQYPDYTNLEKQYFRYSEYLWEN